MKGEVITQKIFLLFRIVFGGRIPNLIAVFSGWWALQSSSRTQETASDRCQPIMAVSLGTHSSQCIKTVYNVGGLASSG